MKTEDQNAEETPQRSGIRLRLPYEGKALDLDSVELAAARAATAARELALAAARLRRASEERERACKVHDDAIRAFTKARNDYSVAKGSLEHADAGNILTELKSLPLPEEGDRG